MSGRSKKRVLKTPVKAEARTVYCSVDPKVLETGTGPLGRNDDKATSTDVSDPYEHATSKMHVNIQLAVGDVRSVHNR